ncbi:MAG: YlaF family protein, partial [Bacillales bacterium]
MKNIKWRFLILAVLAGLSMIGVGISLGQNNMIGTIIFVVLLIAIFGIGFTMKRKMANDGE